jgi:hypothetical protein
VRSILGDASTNKRTYTRSKEAITNTTIKCQNNNRESVRLIRNSTRYALWDGKGEFGKRLGQQPLTSETQALITAIMKNMDYLVTNDEGFEKSLKVLKMEIDTKLQIMNLRF